MAKNIVSQISVHQQHELLNKLEAAGLDGKLAQKVIESRGNTLAEEIVTLIRGLQQLLQYPTYSVLVNYGQTVERLVRAGNYDWANDAIRSRNFPSLERGNAQIDLLLVNFDHSIVSEAVIKWLKENDLRPATLKELLALGAVYPDIQRENSVAALGSTWRDPGGVPCLYGGGSYRHLGLGWFGGDWGPGRRFAAVRK